MNIGMPLVHQARRALRNRADGNPFATLLSEIAAAYAKAGLRAVQLPHVETAT